MYFAFLPSDESGRHVYEYPWICKTVTEVDLWLFVRKSHINYPWRTTASAIIVSGSDFSSLPVPRSAVVISGSGLTSKTWTVTRLLRLFNWSIIRWAKPKFSIDLSTIITRSISSTCLKVLDRIAFSKF